MIKYKLIKTHAEITKATPKGSGSIYDLAGPINNEVSTYLGLIHFSKLFMVFWISLVVIIVEVSSEINLEAPMSLFRAVWNLSVISLKPFKRLFNYAFLKLYNLVLWVLKVFFNSYNIGFIIYGSS